MTFNIWEAAAAAAAAWNDPCLHCGNLLTILGFCWTGVDRFVPIIWYSQSSAFAALSLHTVSLSILMYKSLSFPCQLVYTMMDANASFSRILHLLTPLCNLPLVIFTWTRYLLNRTKFLAFFKNWKRMEDRQLSSSSIRKVSYTVYALYVTFGFVFFLPVFVTLIRSPHALDNDFIYNYFPWIKETHWVFLFRFSTLMTVLNAVIFFMIIDIDIVPIMVYFYVAKTIEALKYRLQMSLNKDHVKNQEVVHQIWFRFEKLRVLIKKADKLFGPIVIFNHGFSFFIICATFFSILNTLTVGNELAQFPIYLIGLLFFRADYF